MLAASPASTARYLTLCVCLVHTHACMHACNSPECGSLHTQTRTHMLISRISMCVCVCVCDMYEYIDIYNINIICIYRHIDIQINRYGALPRNR